MYLLYIILQIINKFQFDGGAKPRMNASIYGNHIKFSLGNYYMVIEVDCNDVFGRYVDVTSSNNINCITEEYFPEFLEGFESKEIDSIKLDGSCCEFYSEKLRYIYLVYDDYSRKNEKEFNELIEIVEESSVHAIFPLNLLEIKPSKYVIF